MGARLATATRTGQHVPTRIGGEEFVIVLISTGLPAAMLTADKVRAAVQSLALRNEPALTASASGFLSVSIGVAAIEPDHPLSREELPERADRPLYRAKHEGRNRVAMAG